MTALTILDGALTKMMGSVTAEQLIEQLGMSWPPVVKILPMPAHISASLQASVSPTLNGQMKILFAQSKVLEYLCALAEHVNRQALTEPRVERKLHIVRELRDYLTTLDGKLPTLSDLTVRYGISARWLNQPKNGSYPIPFA